MSEETDKMDFSESTPPSAEKEQPVEAGEEDRMEEEISQEDMRARRLAKFSTPPSSQSKSTERSAPSTDEQFPMETGTESLASSGGPARTRGERASLSQLPNPGAAHKIFKSKSLSHDKPVPMTPDEASVNLVTS